MDTDRETPQPEAPITWTRKAEWGYDTMVHIGKATINGESWTFHVGYHGSHNWVARGWRIGAFAMYQQTRTMKAAKAACQAKANYAATSTCADCLLIGGHTPTCPSIGRAAIEGLRDGMAKFAPAVKRAARYMDQLVHAGTRKCTCPTPIHRMSCGVGATPKVVSR